MKTLGSVVAATSLSAVLVACGAPPAPPLEPDDFTLYGVPLDADTTEIRLSFGDPDSTTSLENPFENAPFEVWHYQDMEVRFSGGRVAGYLVTGSGETTLRGVRTGTAADSVLRLYGTPSTMLPSNWTYVDVDPDIGLRIVDFALAGDTVAAMYIGRAVQ